MTSPRIPPLPPEDRSEKQTELLGTALTVDGKELNIFTTLVRHPRLYRRWTAFGGVLLTGRLPARDRELLILRTGHRCDAAYEWAQHVAIGRAAGLTDDEIARVAAGPDAGGWPTDDAVVLRAADELHTDSRIGDATWAALAARYDEQQMTEIPMVVGQYHLVAFTLNSLGVQLET